MKVAVVAVAKDEHQYMDEWLKYHTDLGVDQFFIVNNNDIPVGDDYEDELYVQKQLAEKYPVKFFQLYGQDAMTLAGKQAGVYNNIYQTQLLNQGYDWVAFIDLDEFIYLDGKKIKDFLSEAHFEDTDVIHLNWRVYTDNGQIYNSDKPVQERFTQQAPLDAEYNGDEIAKGIRENMFVKSIVRVNTKLKRIDVHTAYVQDGRCRRGNGNLSDCRWSAENLSDDNHYIKHYISKSLQEYITRRCLHPTDAAHYVTPVEKRIQWYFNLNEKTPEKVKYVKDVLGIDIPMEKPTIGIYDCGPAAFDITSEKMGGSETWLKEISKQFEQMKYHVVLYVNVPEKTTVGDIELVPVSQFEENVRDREFFKFIYSRGIVGIEKLKCSNIALMMHDMGMCKIDSPNPGQALGRLKNVYVLSEYAKKIFLGFVRGYPEDRIKITSNGIDYKMYAQAKLKENIMVWSSCKERGFDFYKKHVLPHILKEVPEFKTYICNYNKYDDLTDRSMGIEYIGSLNKKDLADIQKRAKIWCYPNLGHVINPWGYDVPFGETFCITAVENLAAGNVIIAGDMGGLQTTLEGYPLVGKEFYVNDRVEPEKYIEYGKYLADLCVKALRGEYAPKQEPAKFYTWEAAAKSLL